MTSAILQLTAIITMAIDHIGYELYPQIDWLRMIGRLSFPIFAFMLAEGFIHTSDRRKYAIRLAVFAFVSEIPYQLFARHALGVSSPWSNIFFELLLMFLALLAVERGRYHYIEAVLIVLLAEFAGTMYGGYGILLAVVFFVFRDRRWTAMLCLMGLTIAYCLYHNSWFQIYAIAAAVPLWFYNGERGKRMPRYFGYAFYPAHLLLLYGVWLLNTRQII